MDDERSTNSCELVVKAHVPEGRKNDSDRILARHASEGHTEARQRGTTRHGEVKDRHTRKFNEFLVKMRASHQKGAEMKLT